MYGWIGVHGGSTSLLNTEHQKFRKKLREHYVKQKKLPLPIKRWQEALSIDKYLPLTFSEWKSGGEQSQQPIGEEKAFNTFLESQENPAKRILIFGDAGRGKTALCQHITYQWGHSNGIWSNRFDFVFRVDLALLDTITDSEIIPALIGETLEKEDPNKFSAIGSSSFSFLPATPLKAIINEVLNEHSSRSLIIIDGYEKAISQDQDKVNSLMQEIERKPLCALLTSRKTISPTAYSALTQLFASKLELVGLSRDNIFLYINQYLLEDGGENSRKAAYLKDLITANNVIALCVSPINLYLLCFMIKNKNIAELENQIKQDPNGVRYIPLTLVYYELLSYLSERYRGQYPSTSTISNWYGKKGINEFMQKFAFSLFCPTFENYKAIQINDGNIMPYDYSTKFGLLRPLLENERELWECLHCFTEPTWGAFFAAWQMSIILASNEPAKQQEVAKLINRNHYSNPLYSMVCRFVAGFTGLADSGGDYEKKFSEELRKCSNGSVYFWDALLTVSTLPHQPHDAAPALPITNPRHKTLKQCFYEAWPQTLLGHFEDLKHRVLKGEDSDLDNFYLPSITHILSDEFTASSIEMKVRELERGHMGLTERMDTIEGRINGINTRIDQIDTRLQELENLDLAEKLKEVEQIANELFVIKCSIKELNKRDDRNEDALQRLAGDVENRITSLERTYAAAYSDIIRKLREVTSNVDGLVTRVDEVETFANDLQQLLDQTLQEMSDLTAATENDRQFALSLQQLINQIIEKINTHDDELRTYPPVINTDKQRAYYDAFCRSLSASWMAALVIGTNLVESQSDSKIARLAAILKGMGSIIPGYGLALQAVGAILKATDKARQQRMLVRIASMSADSVEMSRIARELGTKLALLYCREPWSPKKEGFIDKLFDAAKNLTDAAVAAMEGDWVDGVFSLGESYVAPAVAETIVDTGEGKQPESDLDDYTAAGKQAADLVLFGVSHKKLEENGQGISLIEWARKIYPLGVFALPIAETFNVILYAGLKGCVASQVTPEYDEGKFSKVVGVFTDYMLCHPQEAFALMGDERAIDDVRKLDTWKNSISSTCRGPDKFFFPTNPQQRRPHVSINIDLGRLDKVIEAACVKSKIKSIMEYSRGQAGITLL